MTDYNFCRTHQSYLINLNHYLSRKVREIDFLFFLLSPNLLFYPFLLKYFFFFLSLSFFAQKIILYSSIFTFSKIQKHLFENYVLKKKSDLMRANLLM